MRPFFSPQPPTPPDSLDRIWAATRPDDPSPALMDALWASAARELDRIEGARQSGSDQRARWLLPPRRGQIIAAVALAQAALILIAVGLSFARRENRLAPATEVAVTVPTSATQPRPPATTASLPKSPATSVATLTVVVPFGQTLVVRIGEDGHQINLVADPTAYPSLPEGMPHDVFNALESMAAL